MMLKRAVIWGAIAMACPALCGAADPQPQESTAVMSDRQIEEALQPPRTRSFAPRGLTRRDAPEAEQSVNLNIPFEHNSSELRPQAAAPAQAAGAGAELGVPGQG